MLSELKKPTTIYIHPDLRNQIKLAGMTVSGAMLAGWEAIADRKKYAARISELEEENRDMQRNIRSMQRMMADMHEKMKNDQHN